MKYGSARNAALPWTSRLPEVSRMDLGAGSPTAGKIPLVLRALVFSIFFFPANMVLKPMGAAGTVPMLLALVVFILWVCSSIFGLHDPVSFRHPGRIGLALLWLGTCASYVALYIGLTGGSTSVARAAADRWLILLLASAGIILVTAEVVRTINDALMLVRALLAGAFFCCLVAVVQFVFRINPMDWIQLGMPGFTDNGGDTPFQARGAFVRVSGSTFHSIELGVVCAMLLPLSVWRALYDTTGKKWFHWTGTGLLVFGIASTVSRSGTLGLVLGLGIFIPFLPVVARRWAVVIAPLAIVGLFVGMPGLVGTLMGSFTVGDADPSISTRTDNYPRVAGMVDQHPLLGTGPGTYMPSDARNILDNQYLSSAVTMGILGLICVIVYLLMPGIAGVQAARVARSDALKCLVGAVAAGGLVAGVCSLTFDSMSFPVFALIYPVFVGLGGAGWIMVKREMALLGPYERDRPTTKAAQSNPKGIQWTR